MANWCRNSDARDWTVYAGYLTRNEMLSAAGNSVSRIVMHNFDPRTNENDIALMKLNRPLTITCKTEFHNFPLTNKKISWSFNNTDTLSDNKLKQSVFVSHTIILVLYTVYTIIVFINI